VLGEYFEEKAYLKRQNRFYRLVIFLLIICIMISWIITYYAIRSEKVVLVPYGLSQQVSVSERDVDNAYLEEFIKFVMYCAFSYTPETVRFQFGRLLVTFSPSSYAKYKKIFDDMAKDVETGGISSSFVVTSIRVNKVMKRAVVTGFMNQWSRENLVVKNEQRRYLLDYEVNQGRIYVKELMLCTGNECNI